MMITTPSFAIPVSKPFLPPEEELNDLLLGMRQREVLTNNGPLVREFEQQLKQITGVKHVFAVGNGTLALHLALRALNIRGKVLTTPFSSVHTLSPVLWEGLEPCFADIDPATLNLSPETTAVKIDDETACILATHLYGNSCDIDSLEQIASAHKVPLIFDAAHAFGSTYKGKDIMSYGTVSITSFHAFKILSCVEGGAIFTNDDQIAENVYRMRYVGYDENMEVKTVGLNGKMSEVHAAFGLCGLKHFEEIKESRKRQSQYYDHLIAQDGLPVITPAITKSCSANHAYYAILFENEGEVLKVKEAFNETGIQLKRYFYPSLNTLSILKDRVSMPVSESAASRVICLPLFFGLQPNEQELIIKSLKQALNG